MNEPPPSPPDLAGRLASAEARLARIETYLRLNESARPAAAGPAPIAAEDLETRLGSDWFAKAGITAVVIGAAYTLLLPYRDLPPAMPFAGGIALSAAIAALGRVWLRSARSVSRYIEGAALALLYVSTLRLSFFGERPVWPADSAPGIAGLTAVPAAVLVLAFRRRSVWLLGIGGVAAAASALAVATPGFALTVLVLLAVGAAIAAGRFESPAPLFAAMPLVYGAYALWAANDPVLGRPLQAVVSPEFAPAAVLAAAAAFAVGLFGQARDREEVAVNVATLFNAGIAGGLFSLHTAVAFPQTFALDQIAAAAVLVGLAALYRRRPNAIGAFVYVLAGHVALSAAIARLSTVPDVFVWLSLQSVLVVATAIAFRSRFIVVANFVIYLGILAGYVALNPQERGISLGFGLVALGSARLLAWKKDRLELKTERMRAAYLAAAFLVFPYALYHLVPRPFVGLAWVAAALLYYGLGAVLANRRYRWMGHGTLLLTGLYLLVAGTSRLEPAYRNASFLALGAVLLAVSILFTRHRKRAP